MKVWAPIFVLGVIGLVAGGSLVILHLHRTIGVGGVGLGALLALAGVIGSRLTRGPVKAESGKKLAPTKQREGTRRAIIAVLVVVLIGVGAFYGTSYLVGIQPGGSQPPSSTITIGQSSQQTGTGTSSSTSSISGTVTTFQPSTSSSSLSQSGTSSTTSSASSSGITSSTIVSGSGSSSSSSASTASSSTTQQTQSSTQSTTASECLGSTKSLDGSTINYNASGTSGTIDLTTHQSSDVIVVLASAVSTPEGSSSTPPIVTGIQDGSGSLSFDKRASFVTVVPGSDGNKFSEEEWYAIASAPLSNDPITVTLSSSSHVLTIIAFAVSGADTSSPFDPNLPTPVGVSGTTQGTISAALSTSCSNDMIIGAAIDVNPQIGTGPGYTLIESDHDNSQTQDAIAEYLVVSAAQTKLEVTFTTEAQPFTHNWLIIADALN